MLFAFIDESGNPHPNDSSERPVLASVCINANMLRQLNSELFRLKRDILGKDQFRAEIKSSDLLTRGTFKNRPDKRELVGSFFEMLEKFPLTVFAVVMYRPTMPVSTDRNFLPFQFRYILQRINGLVELTPEVDLATVMFDGNSDQYSYLSERFSNWMFRSNWGRSLTRLAESPFFVDSKVTPGIQVADMVAGVIRKYQEYRLYDNVPGNSSFLSAISRFYDIVRAKSSNLPLMSRQEVLYGMYFMPESMHYRGQSSEPGRLNQSQ